MAYFHCIYGLFVMVYFCCACFVCVLSLICIVTLFAVVSSVVLHLKMVVFSTFVVLCIAGPPQLCEVNLVHLTQTLSLRLSFSLPLSFFPPPLHLFSVTSLISHCLLTGSESLTHKHGWRDKFTPKRAHDKRNHPAPLFL